MVITPAQDCTSPFQGNLSEYHTTRSILIEWEHISHKHVLPFIHFVIFLMQINPGTLPSLDFNFSVLFLFISFFIFIVTINSNNIRLYKLYLFNSSNIFCSLQRNNKENISKVLTFCHIP